MNEAPMSVATWRTIRHALASSFARGVISEQAYAAAMTEIMGTTDRTRW